MPSSTSNVLLYFLAIWVPFVSVAIKRGCTADLFINIALCCLAWIPGIIHAWYIISKSEKAEKIQSAVAGADEPK